MDKGRIADAGTILEKMKAVAIKKIVKTTIEELVESGYLHQDSQGHLIKPSQLPLIVNEKDLDLN